MIVTNPPCTVLSALSVGKIDTRVLSLMMVLWMSLLNVFRLV